VRLPQSKIPLGPREGKGPMRSVGLGRGACAGPAGRRPARLQKSYLSSTEIRATAMIIARGPARHANGARRLGHAGSNGCTRVVM